MPPSEGPGRWPDITVILLLSGLGLTAGGCQSTGGAGDCTIRPGTTTESLIACGCVRAASGGSTVMAEQGRGPEIIISMVPYICPVGEGNGRFVRVSVVNGQAEQIWY